MRRHAHGEYQEKLFVRSFSMVLEANLPSKIFNISIFVIFIKNAFLDFAKWIDNIHNLRFKAALSHPFATCGEWPFKCGKCVCFFKKKDNLNKIKYLQFNSQICTSSKFVHDLTLTPQGTNFSAYI